MCNKVCCKEKGSKPFNPFKQKTLRSTNQTQSCGEQSEKRKFERFHSKAKNAYTGTSTKALFSDGLFLPSHRGESFNENRRERKNKTRLKEFSNIERRGCENEFLRHCLTAVTKNAPFKIKFVDLFSSCWCSFFKFDSFSIDVDAF